MRILAHGLVGRADLPVPETVFIAAAAAVLVVSFAALAALWTAPRLEHARQRRIGRVPVAVDAVLGALGVAALVAVIYSGLAGTGTTTANLAPTSIFIVFWVGIPMVSLVLGDVFRLVSPWRAIGRGVGWLLRGRLPEPVPYPDRLGILPAVAGLLAFGWVELVWSARDEPDKLVLAGMLYVAAMLVGQAIYGVEQWSRRGDAFALYFGLFARLAPLVRRDGVLHLRRPLAGLAEEEVPRGGVVLLCAAIGITAFDGFSEGSLWASLIGDLQSAFTGAGFSPGTALTLGFTAGLLASVALVTAAYRLGTAGVGLRDASRAFAHTLVPIAAAYVVAHYFSLLAYEGQAMAYLVSDPLGRGDNLFGTAGRQVDYTWITATGIWYVQVGALVAGHVAGLLLAHDRALALTGRAHSATRSQLVMLSVMVAFTVLGLWLLSESNG